MQAGKSVILCASQRTGSTLVFDDFLNVLGLERKNSEILYDRIVLKKTERPWSEVWNEVRELNEVRGYFVCKVMLHYTPIISSFIERNSIAGVRVWTRLDFVPERFDSFHNFFADAIWVHIDRRNVFAQAVSMYMAETTNVWESLLEAPHGGVPTPVDGLHSNEAASLDPSTGSGILPGSVVRYEPERIKGYLQRFLAEREQWQLFFRHYKITPIRISYEEAASGYPHYLKELLDKTGLQMVAAPTPRRMLKVGGQRNKELSEFLRDDVIAELYFQSFAHS
jgi:LPS sulfotransferase NodH